MQEAYHLYGGAGLYRRFPIRATMATAGVPVISVTDTVGVAAGTATSFADAVGLSKDTATYSTTQADLDDPGSDTNIGAYGTVYGLDAGKVVTVSSRDDLVIRALASGAAAAGTALTLVTNTLASAGGTLITDATNVPAADMTSGTVWCTAGANVGHARPIASQVASTSFTVTVPFPRAIGATGNSFLWVPWQVFGTGAAAIDGHGEVQGTTNIDGARADIASGTGGAVMVVGLELRGTTDTNVLFMFADHILKVITS